MSMPKCTGHILSVPLIVECVSILSWTIYFFFYFNCLPDNVLCKIAIWADDTALSSSCDKPSGLSQQVEIAYELWFDLKIWKLNTRNIWKLNSAFNYILMLGKFYIYKLIHSDLKPRILIASFLLAPLLTNEY